MQNHSIRLMFYRLFARARCKATVFALGVMLLLLLSGCGPASRAQSAFDASTAGEVTLRPENAEAQSAPYTQVTVDNLPAVANAAPGAPEIAFAAGGSTGAAQAAAPRRLPPAAEAEAAAAPDHFPCASRTATVTRLDDQRITLDDGTILIRADIERVIGDLTGSSALFITVCTDDLGAEHITLFVLQNQDGPPPPTAQATVCHQPAGRDERARTLHIPQADLQAHLAHGDYPGECREASPPDDGHKVTICHILPDPENRPAHANAPAARTLRIDSSALDAHLAHGDTLGACDDDDDDDDRGRGRGRDDDDDDDDRGKDKDKKKDKDD